MQLRRYLHDLINLFYPNNCVVCHNGLVKGEEVLCTGCLYHLPRTRFWNDHDNPVARTFWGRVNIENACAYFHFVKGSKYQKLLHLLKYNGRQDVGKMLGKELGRELARSSLYKGIDEIIPVPLHAKKQKIRGYNQSEVIARGISETMQIPVSTQVLARHQFTETQTKKNREDRIKNVSSAFMVHDAERINGKHVLLIDDVVTTGATLEVCANTLLSSADVKISIATLAYASDI